MLSIATLFIVGFSVPACLSEGGNINISNEFINSLRSQLRRDNYDYSEEDVNKEVTLIQMRANSKHEELSVKEEQFSRHTKITTQNFYIPALTKDDKRKVKDIRFEKQKSKQLEHVVSNRDLLYYMDDRELLPEKKQQVQNVRQEEITHKWSSATKYKILKLKHQNRRHNQPRLIQEESPGSVAIVSLDGGLFPEVRLPPSRRQYMRARGELLAEDDHVPPPAVDSSEPEAVPEDAYVKTNLTMTTETSEIN